MLSFALWSLDLKSFFKKNSHEAEIYKRITKKKENYRIPVKIVNISQEEDNNKNSEKKLENKNEEKKGKADQIISDINENCSIIYLNYKTFLNLI